MFSAITSAAVEARVSEARWGTTVTWDAPNKGRLWAMVRCEKHPMLRGPIVRYRVPLSTPDRQSTGRDLG